MIGRLPRFLIGVSEIILDCLSGLFRHLEPDSLAGYLLTNGYPIDRVTMRRRRRGCRVTLIAIFARSFPRLVAEELSKFFLKINYGPEATLYVLSKQPYLLIHNI